jgi:DNA-directed RNA polymerase specialized sigma24 family protein
VDDFIHDALLAVCLGKREWPEHIDAFTLLSGIIRSQISHVRQKNRRMRSTDIGPDITPRARQDSRYLTRREDMQEQPDFHEICDKMRELVADDPVLVRIVELWIKDSSLKPSDIAKALKISMTEMRNAQKRLRRRLSALH